SVSATASRFIQASISTSPVSCCCATAATSPWLSNFSAAKTAAVASGALICCSCPKRYAESGRSAAPAQHPVLHRIDEVAALARGALVFGLQTIVPAHLGVGLVDEGQRRIEFQPRALLDHHTAILIEEGAHIGPQQRLQQRENRRRPIDRVIELSFSRAERSHRGEFHNLVLAGDGVIDADARQTKADLGLGRAAQELVG